MFLYLSRQSEVKRAMQGRGGGEGNLWRQKKQKNLQLIQMKVVAELRRVRLGSQVCTQTKALQRPKPGSYVWE